MCEVCCYNTHTHTNRGYTFLKTVLNIISLSSSLLISYITILSACDLYTRYNIEEQERESEIPSSYLMLRCYLLNDDSHSLCCCVSRGPAACLAPQ